MKRILPLTFILLAISACSSPTPEATQYQQPEIKPVMPTVDIITKEQVKKLTNENLAFCEKKHECIS